MMSLIKNERLRLAFVPFRNTLIEIYGAMDHAYKAVADQMGFVCNGCEENCCRSRFYHHTYLEYLYLQEGINRLEPALRLSVRQSAASIRREDLEKKNGSPTRAMCPLNLEGRCSVYLHRPMICRLHGIPHKLQRPGQDLLCGPGCDTFERERRIQNDVRMDRTPFYRQIDGLELKLKKEAGVHRKLKMTIAEMILSFDAL